MSPPGARSNFMRQECLDSKFVFARPLPVSRLVGLVGSKVQVPTQRYGRRPYGVGMLVAGYDASDLPELTRHGLLALRETLPQNKDKNNLSAKIEEPEPPVGSMAEVPMEQALPTRALRAQRTRKENAS
ncbi:proteasome subunit alpha type-1-like isoform X4 [Heptranchias perlo]|uniref:proteasome subunit alpha type-1-like isoform X4 n=1 Tax=Heptranchias perlo TaxID=212740 RepID=UPI00355A0A2B